MSQPAISEDIRFLLNDNAATIGIVGIPLSSFEWKTGKNGKEIDKQILVIDTGYIDTDQKDIYEQGTFAIFVRGKKIESAKEVHDIARAIYEFLISRPSEDINGTGYLQYEPTDDNLMQLGKDANNRHSYVMNFFTFRNPI